MLKIFYCIHFNNEQYKKYADSCTCMTTIVTVSLTYHKLSGEGDANV